MAGLEVLFWIRTEAHFRSLPVVVLSTELPPQQTRMLSKLQTAYCEKALNLKAMISALEQSVRKARSLVWNGWKLRI